MENVQVNTKEKTSACLTINDAVKLIVSAFSLQLKPITFITPSIQSMLWFTKPAVVTADADLRSSALSAKGSYEFYSKLF